MLNLIPSFYGSVHNWTIDLVLCLDIHMQIYVPSNIDLICELVLISLYDSNGRSKLQVV